MFFHNVKWQHGNRHKSTFGFPFEFDDMVSMINS
jgi:hypothetical protein